MNTIHNFSTALIQRTKQAGRYSTSGIYTSTVNSFFRFIGHRSITFAELTPSLIKQYEDRLLGEGRRHNTISTYMRMLRSISHQAAEQGIPFTHSIDDLFAYVFTGYEPTAMRFSRDMFLLSFYLRGIPFVDLVHLRKTDVKHNTIYYYRHKTRQQSSVHIESYAAQIINRYKNEAASSPLFATDIITDRGRWLQTIQKCFTALQPTFTHTFEDVTVKHSINILCSPP